ETCRRRQPSPATTLPSAPGGCRPVKTSPTSGPTWTATSAPPASPTACGPVWTWSRCVPPMTEVSNLDSPAHSRPHVARAGPVRTPGRPACRPNCPGLCQPTPTPCGWSSVPLSCDLTQVIELDRYRTRVELVPGQGRPAIGSTLVHHAVTCSTVEPGRGDCTRMPFPA